MRTAALAVVLAALLSPAESTAPGGRAAAAQTADGIASAGDTRKRGEMAALRARIREDKDVPSVAPAGYDVTIVFFSDYQCPYCRKFHPTLQALLREDRGVRVVYRDWPIFGDVSTQAARAAMAARYQGRHAQMHDALMATKGRLTVAGIRAAADRAGVNWARLQADLQRHGRAIDAALARTDDYAKRLGLRGTPGMMIGRYLLPGAVDLGDLRRAVALARKHPE